MLCHREGGELISIHSADENEGIRKLRTSTEYVLIGLKCDVRTRTLYWVDGTPFNYSNIISPCDSSYAIVVLRTSDGVWETRDPVGNIFYAICGLPGHNNAVCNDYDLVEGTQTCVALGFTKRSWRDAEKSCQQEYANLVSLHDSATNDYLCAKAKEFGLLEGLHIGLETNVSRGEESWTDGSNVTYTNFARGFPNDIFGYCTSIETCSHIGEYVTNSCDNSQLPYACSRPAYDIDNPISEPGCPENPNYVTCFLQIYSPSYPGPPNATACDYFLEVEVGKKVQVTFDDFDLNFCCDKVELYEGNLGGALIGTITGEPLPGTTFQTTSSNVMRVVLTTKDGRFVRGFRAHFDSIA